MKKMISDNETIRKDIFIDLANAIIDRLNWDAIDVPSSLDNEEFNIRGILFFVTCDVTYEDFEEKQTYDYPGSYERVFDIENVKVVWNYLHDDSGIDFEMTDEDVKYLQKTVRP